MNQSMVIVTVSAIAVSALMISYSMIGPNSAPHQPTHTAAHSTPSHDTVSDLQETLGALTQQLQQQQHQHDQNLHALLQQQTALNDALQRINDRLEPLEHARNQATPEPSYSLTTPAQPELSSADLSQWMDDALTTETVDLESTELAKMQIIENLDQAPGVNLEDIQCGQDFCQGVFTHSSSKPLDISELYGKPPFLNEISTLENGDGTTTLYFTKPGVSLNELQLQALNNG